MTPPKRKPDVDDQAAAPEPERLGRIGIAAVSAGELTVRRQAGVAIANAAGDAVLERDPSAGSHSDGDLVVVSVPRGRGLLVAAAIRALDDVPLEELEQVAGAAGEDAA